MAEALGLGVTAWSPLAGGVLSGKYSRAGDTAGATRLDPAALDERAHAVAQAVQDVADARGTTPSQVAIAWTMTRSSSIHPILGARHANQLRDNLGALDVQLSMQECSQLEAATGFETGFPNDFIAQASSWVFGAALVDPANPVRRQPAPTPQRH
jgi:aryl-alcohol dehydrogenase-like predicted oxidoreductase